MTTTLSWRQLGEKIKALPEASLDKDATIFDSSESQFGTVRAIGKIADLDQKRQLEGALDEDEIVMKM